MKGFWEEYIAIDIAKNNFEINWIKRQYPEHIGLIIQQWKIQYQIFGWCWWRRIYRNIDKNIDW